MTVLGLWCCVLMMILVSTNPWLIFSLFLFSLLFFLFLSIFSPFFLFSRYFLFFFLSVFSLSLIVEIRRYATLPYAVDIQRYSDKCGTNRSSSGTYATIPADTRTVGRPGHVTLRSGGSDLSDQCNTSSGYGDPDEIRAIQVSTLFFWYFSLLLTSFFDFFLPLPTTFKC